MNETLKNWLTAITAIAVLTGIGYLLDGPSAAEVETAQAADLLDAQEQARLDVPQVRAEMTRLDAERIEPTPVELMQRYALLGAKQ